MQRSGPASGSNRSAGHCRAIGMPQFCRGPYFMRLISQRFMMRGCIASGRHRILSNLWYAIYSVRSTHSSRLLERSQTRWDFLFGQLQQYMPPFKLAPSQRPTRRARRVVKVRDGRLLYYFFVEGRVQDVRWRSSASVNGLVKFY